MITASARIQGSSPRVWRQLGYDLSTTQVGRFISTCVETAIRALFANVAQLVHLHVCGDSRDPAVKVATKLGSSPRVWRQPS